MTTTEPTTEQKAAARLALALTDGALAQRLRMLATTTVGDFTPAERAAFLIEAAARLEYPSAERRRELEDLADAAEPERLAEDFKRRAQEMNLKHERARMAGDTHTAAFYAGKRDAYTIAAKLATRSSNPHDAGRTAEKRRAAELLARAERDDERAAEELELERGAAGHEFENDGTDTDVTPADR